MYRPCGGVSSVSPAIGRVYQFFGRNYQAGSKAMPHLTAEPGEDASGNSRGTLTMNKAIDVTLTWFGRIWVTCTSATWVVTSFFMPGPHYYIGQLFPTFNPYDVGLYLAWAIATMPGIAAFIARDKLRAKYSRRTPIPRAPAS
jgi:hypothetical protein